jgi:hypothetical protein
MSGRSFLRGIPDSAIAFLLSLWAFLSVIFSNVISKWLYELLASSPNLPQDLIRFLNLKLFSLSNLLLLAAIFSIPLLYINSKLKEERQSARAKVEKDLAAFIYDIFESHLDDALIKIVEATLASNGNSCNPLCILESLANGYFDFDIASLTIYRPVEDGEYLVPTDAIPTTIRTDDPKDSLKFYIGNDKSYFHQRGLAGFTYKSKQLVKIYLDEDRQVFRVMESDNIHPAQEAFPAYRDLGINQLISIRSTAAIPMFKKHNHETDILGVFCVDSTDEEAFKSNKHDDKLIRAARCLAIAIEIQDLLEELN